MLRASKRMFEEFIASAIWDDVKTIVTDRLALVRDDLEAAGRIEEISRLQGEASTLRFFLQLPDRLVSEYEEIMREEEQAWPEKQK